MTTLPDGGSCFGQGSAMCYNDLAYDTGYMQFTEQEDDTGFSQDETEFFVPSKPSGSDDMNLYYWEGFQWNPAAEPNCYAIMQPVLQYGPNGWNEGSPGNWGMTTVLGLPDSASNCSDMSWTVSTLTTGVNSGDTLLMNVDYLAYCGSGCGGNYIWSIYIKDYDIGGNNTYYSQQIAVIDDAVLPFAYPAVMEFGGYGEGICACNQIPSSQEWYGITMYEWGTGHYVNYSPTYVNCIANYLTTCGYNELHEWTGSDFLEEYYP